MNRQMISDQELWAILAARFEQSMSLPEARARSIFVLLPHLMTLSLSRRLTSCSTMYCGNWCMSFLNTRDCCNELLYR